MNIQEHQAQMLFCGRWQNFIKFVKSLMWVLIWACLQCENKDWGKATLSIAITFDCTYPFSLLQHETHSRRVIWTSTWWIDVPVQLHEMRRCPCPFLYACSSRIWMQESGCVRATCLKTNVRNYSFKSQVARMWVMLRMKLQRRCQA